MTDDLFIEEEIMDEMSEYLENYRNKDTECKSTVVEDTGLSRYLCRACQDICVNS